MNNFVRYQQRIDRSLLNLRGIIDSDDLYTEVVHLLFTLFNDIMTCVEHCDYIDVVKQKRFLYQQNVKNLMVCFAS